MPVHSRQQNINPLLGVYFGIFVASLSAIVVILLILEQLGVADSRLRGLMAIGSLGLYVAIGWAAYSTSSAEYFLSGRRVPSVFVGVALAVGGIGGVGLVTFTGALALAGFDALCLPIGIVAGFVVMAVMIAPFLRKFGSISVPSYLGMRFSSTTIKLVAAIVAVIPMILLLVAEVKIALLAAGALLDLPDIGLLAIIMAALVLTLVPGGVRSLSWSSAAQSIAALLAILVPATIIAVMVTNLPLGQMSHGPVLRTIGRSEVTQGISIPLASALTFELPSAGMQPISGRYATPFANVGWAAFVLGTFSVMLGIAASPNHLARTATTPSVYDSRKSIGWAVFICGIVIMTLSALAVFHRDVLIHHIVGAKPSALPVGLKALIEAGFAEIDPRVAVLSATSVSFRRDGILMSLPLLMGFPGALIHLVTAGILAASMTAATACLAHLAIIIGEDVAGGPPDEQRPVATRIMITRITIAAVAVVGGGFALVSRQDPLGLFIWSLAMTASALFPVLMLSIWWKRINGPGALAGLVAGFTITVIALVLRAAGAIAFPDELAAVFGLPASFIAAIATSLLTPAPSRHELELVRDLRIPGGEPVQDRELRLARQERARRA